MHGLRRRLPALLVAAALAIGLPAATVTAAGPDQQHRTTVATGTLCCQRGG